MTTYTSTDLATRVLKDLGVIGSEETPSGADLLDAIEINGSELEQMSVRGILIWNGNELSIPQEYLSALSRRLGLAVGPSYGLFSQVEATSAIIPSEQLLRQLTAEAPTGAVLQNEYF